MCVQHGYRNSSGRKQLLVSIRTTRATITVEQKSVYSFGADRAGRMLEDNEPPVCELAVGGMVGVGGSVACKAVV